MTQVETIDLKGKQYATVPARLKEFRQNNPRASITTKPEFQDEGVVVFTTKITQDKADETSADATGHSYGKVSGEKSFEKLETISVGRALSLLGYLNNGQIASTEELEEFNDYKDQKRQEALAEATAALSAAKSLNELKAVFMALSGDEKAELTQLKDELKQKLEDKNASSKD